MFLNNKPIDFKLDYAMISLGYIEQRRTILLNCTLIYAKYFISKSKYKKTIPSFNNFKKNISNIMKI